MFSRIGGVGAKEAVKQYETTWQGKSPTDCATIEEARELSQFLANKSFDYRGGLGLPSPEMLALGHDGAGNMVFFSAGEMLAAGFGVAQPCHLYLRYAFGEKAIDIEVFDAAYQLSQNVHRGLQNIFDQIKVAAG